MQRFSSYTSKKLVASTLLLMLCGPQAAGEARSTRDAMTRPVTVEVRAEGQPTRGVPGPPPGVRGYGKGAVLPRPDERPDSASAQDQEQPGALPEGRSIEATRKISGVPMAGSVQAFAVSPDGTKAVYIADQNTLGLFELYSTPADGSASPIKISAGIVFGAGDRGVGSFQISPDSRQVIFLADPTLGGGMDDVFSVPIDGTAAPLRLNTTAQAPVTGFGVSGDSARVAFLGTGTAFGTGGVELYRASVGVVSSAVQISDARATNALGNVVSAEFSPNSARLIYAADAVTDGVFQWFSVPLTATGPGSDVQLSAALSTVSRMAITPDSARVVYTGDDTLAGVFDVYSIPIGGGSKIRLNPPMAGDGARAIRISPDGNRVGYLADQHTAGVVEVYSARTTVAASGIRLNSPMAGTQLADSLNVSPDSSTIVYEADQNTAGTYELFRSPIDVGGASSMLHGVTPPDNVGFFTGLGTPIIGRRVVYPVLGATVDVFSVAFDGSAPFVQISGPLAAGDTLLNAFLPRSATRLMAYGNGPATTRVTRAVYSTPLRGDLAPEQVNVTAASGAQGVLGYEITRDGLYAVYLQDQTTSGKPELYSRELDSDADAVVNVADNCPYAANPSQDAVVFGQTVRATSKTRFAWSTPTEVRFVRGPLAGMSGLAFDVSGTLLDAGSYTDLATPAAGAGFYYLFAPDCAGRSYQTVLGAEPARDQAAFP